MLKPPLSRECGGGFEYEINRAVKLLFRALQESLPVKVLSALEPQLRLENGQIDRVIKINSWKFGRYGSHHRFNVLIDMG